MSEWYSCRECGSIRENLCACPNPQCCDYVPGSPQGTEVTFPTGTEKRVIDDITKRQQLGFKKYGMTVANNPLSLKQWLQHAYEETLDLAIYLKRSIEEMEK